MKKIKLIFGTHNNQPVGQSGKLFERSYQNAYKPFLSVLYNFPEIPAVLHYSGTLLQWLEENHSEFLDVLNEMVNRKQIELIGGGFYEPVLPLIPNSDRIGQIESLTTFLRKRFGRRPRGSWVAERVWEPSLASSIKNSGMDYIFLDDHHFTTAGIEENGVFSPCQTEDQGKVIVVFPISRPLRYLVPYKEPEAVIEYLKAQVSTDEENVVTVMDDGEKFGKWEGTYSICYEKKWLERFFILIKNNAEWLEPVLPGRYLKQYNPLRKVYFPCSSYEEMTDWIHMPLRVSGSAGDAKYFDGGCGGGNSSSDAYFRQFLTKYPESNLLYSKMLYTHILVNQLRGDKYRKKAAREELWRGQCNTAYWHGKSGGLYHNRIRKEAYRSLIEAEKVTREKGIFIPSIIAVDFDMDGLKEYLYQGQDLNAYVHTHGATLFELDYLPKSWNYLDTLSRHPENYHTEEMKNRGYDRYLRKAFIDHFLLPEESLEAFDRMTFTEAGDFIDTAYEQLELDRDRHEMTFQRTGKVSNGKGSIQTVEILKKYIFRETEVEVRYRLINRNSQRFTSVFASEVNISLASAEQEDMQVHVRKAGGQEEIGGGRRAESGCSEILAYDIENEVGISISMEKESELWSFPVKTVSGTFTGFEENYQSSCFLLRWNISLSAGEAWESAVVIGFSDK